MCLKSSLDTGRVKSTASDLAREMTRSAATSTSPRCAIPMIPVKLTPSSPRDPYTLDFTVRMVKFNCDARSRRVSPKMP